MTISPTLKRFFCFLVILYLHMYCSNNALCKFGSSVTPELYRNILRLNW
nr:MAG TPA: hypothetical protein [Inoviridae sp.]